MSEPDAPGGTEVMLRVSHYALLGGLCQFIPIPFADDLAERHVRKRMVDLLLDRRGRPFDAGVVKPLYAGPGGSILGKAGGIAKSLVMKPVKKLLKTVFFVATIRRAILESAEILLLGHTIDRLLADGRLPAEASEDALRDEAERIEAAVTAVMASPERRGLTTLVRHAANLLREREQIDVTLPPVTDGNAEAALDEEQRRQLDAASKKLAAELEDERGRSTLAKLDAMIDEHLK
jgi:hypothetical protein